MTAWLRCPAVIFRPTSVPVRLSVSARLNGATGGSDPPVPPSNARLATEGLTPCRAPLPEPPVLHRSEHASTVAKKTLSLLQGV